MICTISCTLNRKLKGDESKLFVVMLQGERNLLGTIHEQLVFLKEQAVTRDGKHFSTDTYAHDEHIMQMLMQQQLTRMNKPNSIGQL